MTGQLIRDAIVPVLDRGRLGSLPDSVVLSGLGDSIAYTTDFFHCLSALLPWRRHRIAGSAWYVQRPRVFGGSTPFPFPGHHP